ncbi:hypothetical protein V8G54_029345 [Vigna mungo]|uniref:ZF-HD dimerization-type domain-containing protein n=1 Tax=Vigna mungo TaxID=3915 RepID=A0AAQ3MT76_VIGMU
MESNNLHADQRADKKIIIRYTECLKNHAASIGGNATDGCGEFIADGEEGTLEALRCSACNCHRNFHRKVSDEKDCENGMRKEVGNNATEKVKKRFRTKFTQEQKEKMFLFAERAGWRIQKLDESVVQNFCQEIGIKRRVLKVWIHNNKNTFAKRNPSTS